MSWLTRISIANRRLAALFTLLVVALGVYAIPSIKQQLIPNLSFPMVTVAATYTGASPEVVERQVAVPIEDAVKSLDGVESVSSTSRQGSAVVVLQLDFEANIDDSAQKAQQAVSRIPAQLPEGVDSLVMTGSTDDQPTIVLAATSEASQQTLAAALGDEAVPELKNVDGVNDVTVSGARDRLVTVTPDTTAMSTAGLTAQDLSTALSDLGTHAAGSVSGDKESLSVSVPENVTGLDAIKKLWVSPPASATGDTSEPVRLRDVASVKYAYAEATSLTRTDGKPSLGISVTMDHDGSAASISEDVRALVPGLEKKLGDGTRLTVVADAGPQVSDSVHGLLKEGLLGLVMAVLVIVLFLRSARSTLVTAISIPLSLVIALIVLWSRDYSLNMLTLGGLSIAVGRVVDDSIVVLENIKRHLAYGEDRDHAIIGAVREVASAVTASTLTTVAVFLPIAFVSGMVGELFGPFAVTVTVAMLASLVVSLTIVPVLAYWFLKPPADAGSVDPEEYRGRVEAEEREGRLQRWYLPLITWSLRRRKTVLAGSLALLVLTLAMTTALKTSFLGGSDATSLRLAQTLSPGSSLAATDAASRQVEKIIAGTDGVSVYQVTAGSLGSTGPSSANDTGASTATYTIVLDGGVDAESLQASLEKRLGQLGGSAGDFAFAASGGVGGGSDVQVTVQADDSAALRTATDRIQQALSKVPEVTEVTSDLAESAPQINVVPKGEVAAQHGLTGADLAAAVNQALQGTTAAQVVLDGERSDIVIRASSATPNSPAALGKLEIPTRSGPVRLGAVATITRTEAPAERTRTDGQQTTTVSAVPVGDDTGAAGSAVESALDKVELPKGAAYTMGGVTSDQSEAFSQLGLAMVAAIALVFLLLIGVFRSIRQTLVLLVSIPFAATGAILLLLITGTPLGLAALIGMLMLIGIVVTNAVVLVDLVNQYREQGMSIGQAVIEGGLRRLRPIVMTALATIFALIPMALGITEAGGLISEPLAVVVIGGLISSTLLTLVLIPTLYTMVETRRERRKRGRTTTAEPSRPQPMLPVH
ncbi:efflux RND transporter permease subunit [Streptomyces sp. NBC_01478]|uniref:efflux RND transporter permease subunit n=1 Tax=Streptomyces sp. NBC_01478 TaxID=2903882 RepID=UPI002E350A6B|nr:efflux RND transporter permease subunit [Streptomyces sp. NBC_01478]